MKSFHYKSVFLLAILAACVYWPAAAQSRQMNLEINYSVSGATGQFRDFVHKQSWNGWQANLLYGINDKLSVGLGTGFQDYYEKYPRDVYKLADGSDISAVVSNSLQTIPILLQGRYNFMPSASIQPYAALGLGGSLVMYSQYLGQFSDTHNSLAFTARPQAGIFVPFGKQKASGINLQASYQFIPYNYNGLDHLNNWNAGIGVKFPIK
ncbi:MAG TPA: outer membrane beta-barrel protein [Chitinophagaceae bacterium]|nr:outer membrane beta-barrel protein [Chitinophagaceae bacterium]